MVKSNNFIATPPGATIKEQLLDRGLSQKEFALRMDMSEKHISRLINGEVQLTPDVAIRLEMVLGIPANFQKNCSKYTNDLNGNKYIKENGINRVSTAYRNCMPGKCNIDFAKEVFEFIVKNKSAYVFIGDFSKFFDRLDHKYLDTGIK